MEKNLGRQIREVLLYRIDKYKVPSTSFTLGEGLWTILFSGKTILLLYITALVLSIGTIWHILRKKREIAQKDTFCLLAYIIGTVFILETARGIKKIDLNMSEDYSDLEVALPVPIVQAGKFSRQSTVDRDIPLGGAAAAYRRLLTKTLREKDRMRGSKSITKEINRQENEIDPALVRSSLIQTSLLSRHILDNTNNNISKNRLNGRTPNALYVVQPVQQKTHILPPLKKETLTEYCIHTGKKDSTNSDLNIPESEFYLLKRDMEAVDKLSKEYKQIEKEVESNRREYRKVSVSLIESMGLLIKNAAPIEKELLSAGVGISSLERAVFALISKYDEILRRDTSATHMRISTSSKSICLYLSFPGVHLISPPKDQDKEHSGRPQVIAQKVFVQEHISTPLLVSSGLSKGASASNGDRENSMNSTGAKKKGIAYFEGIWTIVAAVEALMLVQMFMGLGAMLCIVLGQKRSYIFMYVCICVAFLFSLLLGLYALSYSSSLSVLCNRGLGCPRRSEGAPESAAAYEPQRALSDALTRTGTALQRKIDLLIQNNTSGEIEKVSEQVERLFQLRNDLPLLTDKSPNRDRIREGLIYSAASTIEEALKSLKRIDKRIRSTKWSKVYSNLTKASALLGSSISTHKRHSGLANAAHMSSALDTSTCTGKEEAICQISKRFDSLFLGLFLLSILLPGTMAV